MHGIPCMHARPESGQKTTNKRHRAVGAAVTRFGYFLASGEHGPQELVRQAKMAEQAGFEALWISDHFHPWLDEQGQSPFVWSVIGALSQATSLPITTAVTCPTVRVHPAIVAQPPPPPRSCSKAGSSWASAAGRR